MWRETTHFDRATTNRESLIYCVADSRHTSIRNRTELQFCQQMKKNLD